MHDMGSTEQLPNHVQLLVWSTAMPLKGGTAHCPGEEGLPKSLRAVFAAICREAAQQRTPNRHSPEAMLLPLMTCGTTGASAAEMGYIYEQAHPGQYSFPCTSPWPSSACIHCSGSTKSDVPASPGSSRVSAHAQQARTSAKP